MCCFIFQIQDHLLFLFAWQAAQEAKAKKEAEDKAKQEAEDKAELYGVSFSRFKITYYFYLHGRPRRRLKRRLRRPQKRKLRRKLKKRLRRKLKTRQSYMLFQSPDSRSPIVCIFAW